MLALAPACVHGAVRPPVGPGPTSGPCYRPAVSWHEVRRALAERDDLRGTAFCPAFSDATDAWLQQVLSEAAGGDVGGLALLAVGGYGRRELCPGSDLDLVLVHTGRRDIATVADAVWYPVWDEGARLDHSVRLPAEMLRAASDDLRVQLGLLDGRLVAGDAAVAAPVLTEVADLWHRHAAKWSAAIVDQAEQRRLDHGDLPFLLEPDLKESHGGLRDADVLRCLARAGLPSTGQVDLAALEPARQLLLGVRVELHKLAGQATDRLLLQSQDEVAASLGFADADALMAQVAEAGRAVAWIADDTWRRLQQASQGQRTRRRWRRAGGQQVQAEPARTRVETGVAIVGTDGSLQEVALDADSADLGDVTLAARVAAVAAEQSLPIALGSLVSLSDAAPAPPDPWPADLRVAFVRILAAGVPAVTAFEALDHHGLLVRLLPEWAAVRNKPQRNAYHRFTVDRHLLEAAAQAAPLALASPRPDLLLVGTLLHDIGKGFPGDHTEVGEQVVATMGRRMGFSPADVDMLVGMVRYHLLLPDVATRRDLDDPTTVDTVAGAVGNVTLLSLLAALTEADSLATGPSAWGPWKAGLVADLVGRTRARLTGELRPATITHAITERHRALMTQAGRLGRSVLVADVPEVTVVARDRPGLLATVTGVLALFGLSVRSADVTGADGFAVERFVVEASRGRWPDWTRVADDLEAALRGSLPVEQRLADKARAYDSARRATAARPVATRVSVDNGASDAATVVDVRTTDGVGVLHRLTRAVFDSGFDVVTARASTLGAEVVDSFYLLDPPTGTKVTDAARLRALEQAIVAAADGSSPTRS